MNIPTRTLDVKCIECGKHFEATTHKRMGMINVTCPHCKSQQQYMVTPPKIGEKKDDALDKFKTMMPVKILGSVISQNGRYIIENRARIGRQSSFICPKCNKPIAIKPTVEGEQAVTCKECNTQVFITAYDAEKEEQQKREQERLRQEAEAARRQREEEERRRREEEERLHLEEERRRREEEERRRREEEERRRRESIHPEPEPSPTPEPHYDEPEVIPEPIPGPVLADDNDDNETRMAAPKRVMTNYELRWGGGLLSSAYKIRLLSGTTIVGRRDPNTPSDIQFNDPEMSRRSVRLDIEGSGPMPPVTLTVQKDLNPVLVNGRRIQRGESIRLMIGAKIKMGQTEITFKKI